MRDLFRLTEDLWLLIRLTPSFRITWKIIQIFILKPYLPFLSHIFNNDFKYRIRWKNRCEIEIEMLNSYSRYYQYLRDLHFSFLKFLFLQTTHRSQNRRLFHKFYYEITGPNINLLNNNKIPHHICTIAANFWYQNKIHNDLWQ